MGTQEARTGRFKCSLKYSRDKLPKSPRKPTTAVRVEWEEDDEKTFRRVEYGREFRKPLTDKARRYDSDNEPVPVRRRRRWKEEGIHE